MHLSSHPDHLPLEDQLGLASGADEHSGAFLWVCLPEKIQHHILHHAFFPSDLGDTALVMGKPSRRAHFETTAIPILLGQGNWQAYTAAARVLYSDVHLALVRYPDAAMHFLTSPTTLRLRNLVCKLQIRMDIENDLYLFDEGWRATNSLPEARVNVPTALHSMHIHGRLSEVHFLLNVPEIIYHPDSDLGSGFMSKCAVPSYYLPMARLQLAHRDLHSGETSVPSSTLASQPGREVIAPTFLAGRAFQHGFLPLFGEGVVWKSDLSLEMVLEDDQSRVEGMEVPRWFRYWLGTTILEVLGNNIGMEIAQYEWVNPFTIRRNVDDRRQASVLQRCEASGDKASFSILPDGESDRGNLETDHHEAGTPHRRTTAPRDDERIGYKARGDDLVDDSPIRYDTSVPSSASSSVDGTEHATTDFEMAVQANMNEDEVMDEVESSQNGTQCDISQSGGSNNHIEVLSLCLDTVVPHAVMGKIMDSVETSRMCGNSRENPESSSSFSHEAVARKNRDKGKGVSVVTETVSDETSASISLALHDEMESRSSSDSSDTSSEDLCSTSCDATCGNAEIASRTDIATTAPSGQQDSGEDNPVSELPAPNLIINSANDAVAATPVEKAPGWMNHDSNSITSRRGQDRNSPSESDDDSASGSDCSSANDEHENSINQTARIQQIDGRSTMTTNPQAPVTPTALPQASQRSGQDEGTTSLKRKSPHEEVAQAKKSKKARWRANRRARLLARTAAEE